MTPAPTVRLPSPTPESASTPPWVSPEPTTPLTPTDEDGDGVDRESDCDDTNPTVYPGALELEDGVDNDCDGEIDEAVSPVDADQDGYPASPAGDDCNDADPTVYPGAEETCNGIDDDCDGQVDEDTGDTWYQDLDGDGYGNPDTAVRSCTPPEGHVSADAGVDCRDTNDHVHPGAEETCNGIDDDCDGQVDEGATITYYADADGDGYGDLSTPAEACKPPEGYVSNALDCNDADPAVSPGALEQCNGKDDNCNGAVDEGILSVFYADADGDGYGDASSTLEDCAPPEGYVANDADCRDDDPTIYPGAEEVCNGKDEDCDSVADEGVTPTWYRDADGDGHGTSEAATDACEAPAGYVAVADDCDDTRADVGPDMTEVCDPADLDENCNGLADDADPSVDTYTQSVFYQDADGDGYGDPTTFGKWCEQPQGHVDDHTDCDDSDPKVHPGATETCNNIDDDCDGTTDEGVRDTWYLDGDSDGYGDADNTVLACSPPSGYSSNSTDCDDTDPNVHPDAAETCNNIDDDCDGQIDEDGTDLFFQDLDGDGYGNPEVVTIACSAPPGYVSDDSDCDDTLDTVNPAGQETCNGIDDDCDGRIDEDVSDAWYRDNDGDGYGDPDLWTFACYSLPGYADNALDCDDSNSDIHPGATEICNELDDDCNGLVDDGASAAYTWSDTLYDFQTASSEFGNTGAGMFAARQTAPSSDACLALEVRDFCRVVAKGFDQDAGICIVWALRAGGAEPDWGSGWDSVDMRTNCGAPGRPVGCLKDGTSGYGYVSQACADDYIYDGTSCPTSGNVVWKRVLK